MDMSDSSTMDEGVSMIPFFHFYGGDYLIFKAWRPVSAGAIAGACIGLFFLALFDRWVSATRGVLENRWRHTGLTLTFQPLRPSGKASPSPSNDTSEKSLYSKGDASPPSYQSTPTRTIPPFIFAHDVPRGCIHAAQALLAYILMLAVMTFNAAYLISIVLGLGIGEVIFGRMGNGRGLGH